MIQSFDRDAKPEDLCEVLDRDGVVIVRERFAEEVIQQIEKDLQPALEKAKVGSATTFFGNGSKVISGVYNHSLVLGDLMTDPTITGVADIVLSRNCDRYQIGVSALLEVWKVEGAERMQMHRDSDTYYPYGYLQKPDVLPIQVQSMFAISDFTPANGATRFVLGSHRWPQDRQWKESEVEVAAMPRGSVAMWIGGMLHGSGVNQTDKPRTGITSGFTVGWLRQEQNHYLLIPEERIAQFPQKVRDLLGWAPYSAILGFTTQGYNPDDLAADQRKRREKGEPEHAVS